MKETCDDIGEPGFDIETGWGLVNIYRAIYGSDPNESEYDANGHLPHPGNGKWEFDNIHDISTSADYDFEDIFVLESTGQGLFRLDVDILATGEDLNIQLYDNPELTGEPVVERLGPNGEENPVETIEFLTSPGDKYYLRVFSAGPNNSSNYAVRFRTEEYSWWINLEKTNHWQVKDPADDFSLFTLEFNTSLLVTPEKIQCYISEVFPLSGWLSMSLYEDTNDSGKFEADEDALAKFVDLTGAVTNQVVFDGLTSSCTYENPLRYFIACSIGANLDPLDTPMGLAIQSYKDVTIAEELPLRENPFPIFTGPIQVREIYPPVWEAEIGVQKAVGVYQAVDLYWNGAVDIENPLAKFNVYWDDEFPPEISAGKMVKDIPYKNGGTYLHKGRITGLENDMEYFFLVRTEDAIGNEDTNDVWLPATPDGVFDPEHPGIIVEKYFADDFTNLRVENQIAYISHDDGCDMVDCSNPGAPVITAHYNSSEIRDIQYHAEDDLIYVAGGGPLAMYILELPIPQSAIITKLAGYLFRHRPGIVCRR